MNSVTDVKERLNVVIPVYNEEKCILKVVENWAQSLDSLGIQYEMLILNDGSSDNTYNVLKTIENPKIRIFSHDNLGHGRTVRKGYQIAIQNQCSWVFQVDSDDQFDGQDFKLLWGQRDKSHFLLGTRSNRSDPLNRIIISKIMTFFVNSFFQVRLLDPNSPFRLIKTDFLSKAINKIPETMFTPNIALSILAYYENNDIIQIPVTHRQRKTGKISILGFKLIKICIKSLFEIINFKKALKNNE